MHDLGEPMSNLFSGGGIGETCCIPSWVRAGSIGWGPRPTNLLEPALSARQVQPGNGPVSELNRPGSCSDLAPYPVRPAPDLCITYSVAVGI